MMNGSYGHDPDDATYVPNPSAFKEDEQDFDVAKHLAEFQEKQERVLKARAAEYDANIEGRKLEKEPENLVINGIAIPEVTPDEPEYLVERIPVQDPTDGGLTNMPYQSSKQYKSIKRINPNCITPEKRASLIAEARKAVAAKQGELSELEYQKRIAHGFEPLQPTPEMFGTPRDTPTATEVAMEVMQTERIANDFITRVNAVVNALPDENIIGFEVKDGHLVITLE